VSGLLKGFVPAVTISRAASIANALSSNPGNTTDLDADFKTGGLENLDEDGHDVADKNYPKYAQINAKGRGGIQVQCPSLNTYARFRSLTRFFNRIWSTLR
jgi:hypothetical protein